jgi:hypothetical protein
VGLTSTVRFGPVGLILFSLSFLFFFCCSFRPLSSQIKYGKNRGISCSLIEHLGTHFSLFKANKILFYDCLAYMLYEDV